MSLKCAHTLTIDGYNLNAGMYLYSLIADNKEVDTQKDDFNEIKITK